MSEPIPDAASTAPARLFLWLGLVFGLLTVFVTPPFQVPDEPAHFYRAIQISDGDLFATTDPTQGNPPGGWMPRAAFELTETALLLWNSHRHPAWEYWSDFARRELQRPPAPHDRQFVLFSNTALYTPTTYAPQVLGIGLARVFNLSWLEAIYLARIAALLTWVGCIYLALRLLPFGHWLMAALALMPMSLYLAASASADSFTFALAFLFTAAMLHLAFRQQPLANRDLAWALLLAVLLALAKQLYLPLLLLFLLIPPARLGWRRYAGWMLGFGLIPLAVLALWTIPNQALFDWHIEFYNRYTPHLAGLRLHPQEQMELISRQPAIFFHAMSAGWEKYAIGYWTSFIGAFGWLQLFFPRWLVYAYSGLLLAALLTGNRGGLHLLQRKLLLVAGGVALLLIHLLHYLTSTEVDGVVLEGIQGRYFIPAAPAFLLGLYYPLLPEATMRRWLALLLAASLGYMQFFLIRAYY